MVTIVLRQAPQVLFSTPPQPGKEPPTPPPSDPPTTDPTPDLPKPTDPRPEPTDPDFPEPQLPGGDRTDQRSFRDRRVGADMGTGHPRWIELIRC